MRNPYEVLGLPSTASMDQVKKAYREMARKFNDNPSMMDEINQAYDTIVMNFGNNNAGNSYSQENETYSEDASGNYAYGTSEFGDIRAKLNSGRIDDAETLLDGIPQQKRNAEWYYLKGTIQHRRGWLESAAESFERAKNMEPGNPEYQAAFKQIHKEKNGSYRTARQHQEKSGCSDPCNICTSLLCADCCCECMGGDLIRCC